MSPDRSEVVPSVVVVEDEPLVRELAVCELEECGFHVIDFATADEALLHLAHHADRTSVVFTDVQMPGRLNGLDLTLIVSRTWPDIKVVVTSGGHAVDERLLPPCACFVPKPWRSEDVVARISRLAGDGRAVHFEARAAV